MECVFDLTFRGSLADNNQIQFYDVAQALAGFERCISLTTHMLLNGEAITQSPSARGFSLVALPSEEGSWKFNVVLFLGSTVSAFGLAPPDTMFGWLAKSAVEYVVQESLGFTPNFEETLGSQIERYRSLEGTQPIHRELDEGRFDSVIEKTEAGIRTVHRPIVFSGTADRAQIGFRIGADTGNLELYFDQSTFEYMSETYTSEDVDEFCGVISSYNVNTFKGRLYVPNERRTLPFELSEEARSRAEVDRITTSLRNNARTQGAARQNTQPDVCLKGFRNESSSGRLKRIFAVGVHSE